MTAPSARSLTVTPGRGSMRILAAFIRAYPARSSLALFAVFLAGLLDGLGLSMLLSMLTLAGGGLKGDPSLPERVALQVVERLGLQPTAVNLLLLAIALISLKAVLSLLANRQVGYTVAHIATDLRLTLIRAVLGARWPHYLQQSVGRLSNAVATEAQRASEIFQFGAEMSVMVLNSIIYMGIALSIAPQAGIAAAVAGGLLLALLHVLIRRLDVYWDSEPLLNVPGTMLIGLVTVVFAFGLAQPIAELASTATRNSLGIAVAVILLAFITMITRRKAMSQVVGFLSMENGLFFGAMSTTYGMPMIVELGVALDVLVAMLVLGVFFFQIREQFDSLDLHHLESLKEDQ